MSMQLGQEILTAIKAGDTPQRIRQLMVGTPIDARNSDGWTALMYAAYYGQTETARMLLDAVADVDAKSDDGWTALMWATAKGHPETVRMLLDAGADVEAKDKHGKTALIWFGSAYDGDTDIARMLLERGADMEAKDNDGKTALMWAAVMSHAERVGMLLEGGADVEAKDKNGETALMLAKHNNLTAIGHSAVVALLKRASEREAKIRLHRAQMESAILAGDLSLRKVLPGLPKEVDKFIVWESHYKHLCEDIADGTIASEELIALARILNIDISAGANLTKQQVCARVYAKIKHYVPDMFRKR